MVLTSVDDVAPPLDSLELRVVVSVPLSTPVDPCTPVVTVPFEEERVPLLAVDVLYFVVFKGDVVFCTAVVSLPFKEEVVPFPAVVVLYFTVFAPDVTLPVVPLTAVVLLAAHAASVQLLS